MHAELEEVRNDNTKRYNHARKIDLPEDICVSREGLGSLRQGLRKIGPACDAGEIEQEKALADCIRRLEERRLRLQEEFITSEGVSMVSAGEDLDSAELTIIREKTAEVDAQLVRRMQERTEPSFSYREDQ